MRRQKRVPVVLQTSLADCGAACLTMILCYHEYAVTLREVRRRLGLSRDGLTALALIEAAHRYGLAARAFSLDPAELARMPPAVVHWQFNHFLVLERWSASGVDVVDPAVGRHRMTCEAFDAGFTGVVLTFEPGPNFQPRKAANRRPWRMSFMRSVLSRYRGLWAQVLISSLALQLLGLALPAVTEIVVDHVTETRGDALRGDTLLSIIGLGLALAAVGQVLLGYLRNTLLVSLRLRADSHLTTGVVTHMLALPYSFFAQRGAADLVMRTGSVSVIRQMIAGNVLPTVLDAPLALGYIVLVFVRDPVLGGALTAVALVQLGIVLGTRRQISQLAQQELVAQSAAQGYLIEAIKGIETLKAAGAEADAAARWSRRFVTQLNATTRAGQRTALIDAILGGFRVLAPVVVIWIGAWRVLDGALSLGTMLGLSALAVAALAPVTSLTSNIQLLQTASAHVDRLLDIMESEPERAGTIDTPMSPLRGGIDVRGVGFRYDSRAPWILRDISLTAMPGQKVALVGRSGSGKSTLARILLNLYAPTEGQLTYDGVPAEDIDPRFLRSQFGVVTQEPAMFTGTIRENISLGDAGATMERVAEAARLACIHDEILELPMKYETMLSEGSGLSGGQRQRVALARALLTRPKILVLDEATSHLDTATEATIETSLSRLPQTRIVVAHRLSTVRDADVILVLEHGRIAEGATHDELMALGGHYARLVEHQTV